MIGWHAGCFLGNAGGVCFSCVMVITGKNNPANIKRFMVGISVIG